MTVPSLVASPESRVLSPWYALRPPEAIPATGLEKLTFALLWSLVFSVPFETMVMVPGWGTISRLIAAVITPVAILALAARGYMYRVSAAYAWMAAFTVWATLSYFWTVWPDETSDRIYTYIQLLLAVLIITQFSHDATTTRRLSKAYIFGTLVSCGSTLIRYAAGDAQYYQRFAARNFDPNDLSLTLALSLPLSYYFFLHSQRRGRIGWVIQIIIAFLTCLLTASRMGIIASVVALLIVPFTIAYLSARGRIALILAFVLSIMVCLSVVPQSSWKRLATISTEVSTGTLNGRKDIWRAGSEVFTSAPWTGIGAGAFKDVAAPLLSNYYESNRLQVAHNTYISVLTELGVVGMLLFLGVLGAVIQSLLRLPPGVLRKACLLTIIVWAVGVSTLTWEHRKPTWIIFALLLQTSATYTRERVEPQ